jgi:hypothetical protein
MLKESLAQEDIMNGEIDEEIGSSQMQQENDNSQMNFQSRGKTSSVISCQ